MPSAAAPHRYRRFTLMLRGGARFGKVATPSWCAPSPSRFRSRWGAATPIH